MNKAEDKRRRVGLGRTAVEAFAYGNRDAAKLEMDELLTDLIVDVMHYAKSVGESPESILSMATIHYNSEA